jgi:putative inorganic carbon (HCO3(-)) transporter
MRETLVIGLGAFVAVIVLTFGAVYIGPAALLLLVAAYGLVLILRRPWVGIAVLVVYLPLNSMVSSLIGDGPASVAFGAVKDAILLLLFLIVLFSRTRLARVSPSTTMLVLFVLLLAVASSLQTPNVQQALYGLRNDYLPLLLLVVVPAILTASTANAVAKVLAVSTQLFSLIAIWTWSIGLDWLFTMRILPVAADATFPSSFFVQGSIIPRAFSPFAGPNELAVSSAVCVGVILCRSNWHLVLRLLLSVLPIAALILTQSRSGLIGLALVLVVLGLRKMSRAGASVFLLGALATLVAAACAAVLLTNSLLAGDSVDLSAQGHALSLFESLPQLGSSFFGAGVGQVGPRAFLFTDDPILVESFWLVLGLEAGALVMVLYLVIQAKLVVAPLKARSLEAFTAVVVLAAALVSQIVLPTLQDSATAYLLWIAVGLGTMAAADESAKPLPLAMDHGAPSMGPSLADKLRSKPRLKSLTDRQA